MPIIKSHVKVGSTVYTDEASIYCNLNENGYDRQIVNHKQKEFSVGRKSTNTIEGFWGQFKRMVYGTYHYVSRRYMQRYIDEAVYRYNTRKASESTRFADMFYKSIGIVSYMDVKSIKRAA